jgi:predicted transcriptional regulator
MNKLEVAIKLLRLVNKRKTINSRIIAEEFSVSLRTAQRYLRELSNMLFIERIDNEGNFEIYSDLKIKEAVLNPKVCDLLLKDLDQPAGELKASGLAICNICGYSAKGATHDLLTFGSNDADNETKLIRLLTTIENIVSEDQVTTRSHSGV